MISAYLMERQIYRDLFFYHLYLYEDSNPNQHPTISNHCGCFEQSIQWKLVEHSPNKGRKLHLKRQKFQHTFFFAFLNRINLCKNERNCFFFRKFEKYVDIKISYKQKWFEKHLKLVTDMLKHNIFKCSFIFIRTKKTAQKVPFFSFCCSSFNRLSYKKAQTLQTLNQI